MSARPGMKGIPHRVSIHLLFRGWPWRWVKVVNENTRQTAYSAPWPGWFITRALDKVHEGTEWE